MHAQQQELQTIQAHQREQEQAVELADIVGVEDAAQRVDPVVPATIRFGDPALMELLQKQARIELMDEVLAALRDTEPAAQQQPEEDEEEAESVNDLPYVSDSLASTMAAHGYGDVDAVANATPEELATVPGIGNVKANQLITAAGGDPEANIAAREEEAEPKPEPEPDTEPEEEPQEDTDGQEEEGQEEGPEAREGEGSGR